MSGKNSYGTLKKIKISDQTYHFHSLNTLAKGMGDLSSLPFSLKILLENTLRLEDGRHFNAEDVEIFLEWMKKKKSSNKISFLPSRVLMQDFTGVPAVVDLAAMRSYLREKNRNPKLINPQIPVDLVVDHSVSVDAYGTSDSKDENVEWEYQRNKERYEFLKWAQESFENFRVVPPGTGICHQVNLEHLAQVSWIKKTVDGNFIYPDTVVGTDSHTTMVNALGVLGWGVGGIEAEAAMLGQPISMLMPSVVGFQLTGELAQGCTATDLVLTITNILRKHGVVGKFVEFYGPGIQSLTIADRATISNMSPEFGSTCALFPIDEATLSYLKLTGRSQETIACTEAYAKEQGFWHQSYEENDFTESIKLDLSTIEPTLAGPKRPQDKLSLKGIKKATESFIENQSNTKKTKDREVKDGDVVIAAITSCTNTSNPDVLVCAGLLAENALKKGIKTKPWVKTSFAPGSKVVSDYMEKSGLQKNLDALGFYLVGYGCTTCIGNSGPLDDDISKQIDDNALTVTAVLSGNRNFEGRIHPQVKLSYLASPPLVVAYALAGTSLIDLETEPLGHDSQGNPVYLKDIWPTQEQIRNYVQKHVQTDLFTQRYNEVFQGDQRWKAMENTKDVVYRWQEESTYVKLPPYFQTEGKQKVKTSLSAKILAILGDSTTTDHISPAGAIRLSSPAATYLKEKGVEPREFNSYGSRRGNHEVMMRGTFANIRLVNEMIPEKVGGFTVFDGGDEPISIYDAAMKYKAQNQDLIIVAGKEYGTGSSRDWAAKGTNLLGVKAIIAESYERIHRSNLIGMGVLPLEFTQGQTRKTLKLSGVETIEIPQLSDLKPKDEVKAVIKRPDGSEEEINLLCRIDTPEEMDYYLSGGILWYVLDEIVSQHQEI